MRPTLYCLDCGQATGRDALGACLRCGFVRPSLSAPGVDRARAVFLFARLRESAGLVQTPGRP